VCCSVLQCVTVRCTVLLKYVIAVDPRHMCRRGVADPRQRHMIAVDPRHLDVSHVSRTSFHGNDVCGHHSTAMMRHLDVSHV